jgi:hypothetical protein
MFCKKRQYKNPTCFGPHSMTIFRCRHSFLAHLLPFSCLLRHLSILGFVAVCPLFVCVPGVQIQIEGIWPQTHKKTNDEAGS